MTSNDPLPTRPLYGSENVLREKFAASIAGQSELMDRLAQQLISIELAIPGSYAAVLKLVAGEQATMTCLLYTSRCV